LLVLLMTCVAAAACQPSASSTAGVPDCEPGDTRVFTSRDLDGTDWLHLSAGAGPRMNSRSVPLDPGVPAGRWEISVTTSDPGAESPDTPNEQLTVAIRDWTSSPTTDLPPGSTGPQTESVGVITTPVPVTQVQLRHVGPAHPSSGPTDSVYIDAITFACSTPPGPEPTGTELSVMSFNIRFENPSDDPDWPTRLPAVERMLDQRQPDVIGFQEALADQVDDLAELLEGYDWVGVGRDDGVAAGEFAPVFFRTDRFELSDHGHFWLSESPGEPSLGWDAALPRIVTWVELGRIGSTERFRVYNTHFDHEGQIARQNSAELLATVVAERPADEPVVVLGDLNVLAADPVLDPLGGLARRRPGGRPRPR